MQFLIVVALLAAPALGRVLPPVPALITAKDSYIIGGSSASISANPWQGSLQSSSGAHSCGCVRISSTFALTAAHCISGSTFQMRFGSANRNSGGGVYRVAQSTRHPSYGSGSGSFPNDIAVLRSTTSFTHGSNIALAGSGDFIGTTCRITGWGRTQVGGGGGLPTQLQGTNIQTMSGAACRSSWGGSVNYNIHICVGGDGRVGACNGDSGGPLVCNNRLVGVTSWGVAGCSPTRPSVYTRVHTYTSWIRGICGC